MALKGKNELERFTDKFGYNKIWDALTEWIEKYSHALAIDGSDIALDDFNIKFTRNLQVEGCCFTYNAVVEAYIAYTDMYRDAQSKPQWFTVRCAAEVDNVLKSFKVLSVEIYSQLPAMKRNATENFVPIVAKSEMDGEARAFLRKHCPKALLEPTKVPIHEIAVDIGLRLEFGYMLSEDFSYLGQISFSDTKTHVFDIETGKSQELDVNRGTILIDPDVFWERSLGCKNFTIAHEVVHWDKHRLFADIKRLLYCNDYTAHRCPKPVRILWDPDDRWTDNEWLEWHANSISARILMPKETVPAKINEIKATFPPELMADKYAFFIALIDELAKFYGTSRLTAKYRLKDLGYEAVGDIQIHEYDFQRYTHEIDEYKAYYEICDNKDLRMLVNSGLFIYADRHFVINHDECVSYDENGVAHLTDFSMANIEKCTLKFLNIRMNLKESGKNFSDILYRGKSYETFQKYDRKENGAAFKFARELAATYTVQAPEREKTRVSLCDRVQQIFEAKNIDPSGFQALTLLSRDTYYKLKRPDYKPAFETIIALCAGLDLDIIVTNELLNKAGYSFDGGEKHSAYMAAITQFLGKSILVRNEFLRNLNIKGVKPLGEKDAE